MILRTAAVLLSAFAALAACAPREEASFAYSDAETIRAALTGSSVIGQYSDGTSYCEFHDPGGMVVGRDWQAFAGNWRMVRRGICYAYPGEVEDCQFALVEGNRVRFLDGYGATISSGNIVQGNVCN